MTISKEYTYTTLLTENPCDGVLQITLHRPDALNALNATLRNEIAAVFDAAAQNDSIEVIVLTGSGRAFTVGLDLKELGGEVDAAEAPSGRDLRDAMLACGKPIIGAVNGFAITGGFEIALLCDFLIASPQAKFADTHARVGVVPGWGLSQRLPRLIGINRARELSLTGNYLDADTACAWGLVNRVVPEDELLPTCVGLAQDILSTDRATRTEMRRIMTQGWETTLENGLGLELEANRAHDKRESPATKVAQRRADIQSRGRNQSN